MSIATTESQRRRENHFHTLSKEKQDEWIEASQEYFHQMDERDMAERLAYEDMEERTADVEWSGSFRNGAELALAKRLAYENSIQPTARGTE